MSVQGNYSDQITIQEGYYLAGAAAVGVSVLAFPAYAGPIVVSVIAIAAGKLVMSDSVDDSHFID